MSINAAQKNETSEQSYDEIPYMSTSYWPTHPPHISTVATLLGLTPPDFKTAKVLEVGCAGGGNLLPLALVYPDAHFLGIDFSQAQIEEANQQKAALKLGNIEFRKQDILEFDTKGNKGKFDYIIAHGVFSWVPDAVREKLLEVCGATLSPHGLAIISYNVLPGWNAVRSLREIMLYHTRNCGSLAEKVRHSRALLDTMLARIPQNKAEYRAVVEAVDKLFKGNTDSYIAHDFLEMTNKQFYFHEFAEMIGAHGLDYVADANIHQAFSGDALIDQLTTISNDALDAVEREQYADFISNRGFRTAIIGRKGQQPNKNLKKEKILDYFVSPGVQLTASGSDPSQPICFTNQSGDGLNVHDIGISTMILELMDGGPVPIAAQEFITRVQEKLGLKDSKPVQDGFVEHGLMLALNQFMGIHSDQPHHVSKVSKKPVAFPLARLQAARENWAVATNVMGQTIPIQGADKLVLQCLDGSNTVEDIAHILVEDIRKNAEAGAMGKPAQSGGQMRANITNIVKEALPRLAKQGLLVG